MATKKKASAKKKSAKVARKGAKPAAKKKAVAKKSASKVPVKKKVAKTTVRKTTAKAPAKKAAAKQSVKKAVKKAPAKKPVKKVTSKKVTAPKKAAPKRPAAKKAVSVKKPVGKPAAPKAATSRASGASKQVTESKPVVKVEKPAPRRPGLPPVRPLHVGKSSKSKKIKKLTAKELKAFHQALLNFRDQVVDGISFLSGDNLNRSQRDASGDLSGYSLHMADQGTDNYDREFALNLVSTEQDLLYEIDEAIRRIQAGTYGVCELTGEPIERARLKVLPYARYSVSAQAEMERGKKRYRPFGPTLTR